RALPRLPAALDEHRRHGRRGLCLGAVRVPLVLPSRVGLESAGRARHHRGGQAGPHALVFIHPMKESIMSLRTFLCQPRVLIQLGLCSLVIGSLTMRLHPGAHFTADAKDGLTGFFYGVAIAAMLLGIARQRRARSERPDSPS